MGGWQPKPEVRAGVEDPYRAAACGSSGGLAGSAAGCGIEGRGRVGGGMVGRVPVGVGGEMAGRVPVVIAQVLAGLPRMYPSSPPGVNDGCAAIVQLASSAVTAGPVRLRMAAGNDQARTWCRPTAPPTG